MTALAQEKEAPKVHREIEEFRKKYAEALEGARISAEHTQTEGWKNLYHLNRTTVENRRKELGEQLEELSKTMKRGGMDEDYEKMLGEIKKASAELRADISAFQRKVITPVEDPVLTCHAVIEEARRAARYGETQSPLTHRGLVVEMDDAIKGVEKVTFEAEFGTVEIAEPVADQSQSIAEHLVDDLASGKTKFPIPLGDDGSVTVSVDRIGKKTKSVTIDKDGVTAQ